ncbi:hypothetical protein FOCG_11883 [Fusarium oxysporum f. sp. radicis-lycopersici 26381]|uniref:Uncharacterized protein n=3 Tax=Fusarium oxysporum TaxID=5507 RepID=A0A4Q2V618_FUSOX|nr:hypothetical protein FOZG_02322 [Fusarium oxysporum Fo47]EXL47734.1 hypothetical protein FOCG_11883 [Fusarium oxysporum f. sp. radicis-lycopersici 26381]RKK25613.1 hypothetical protein BFJ65_g3520 [Fusarium oxysporum f. sp. cepae]RKL17063.1 hypothetical protein BFJ70_g14745 [Fusarium oxysporum]RYC82284.1 hypothetical protein BFJ63_vAg14838 [Fusarium oxysporum f. sp. narcissi]
MMFVPAAGGAATALLRLSNLAVGFYACPPGRIVRIGI